MPTAELLYAFPTTMPIALAFLYCVCVPEMLQLAGSRCRGPSCVAHGARLLTRGAVAGSWIAVAAQVALHCSLRGAIAYAALELALLLCGVAWHRAHTLQTARVCASGALGIAVGTTALLAAAPLEEWLESVLVLIAWAPVLVAVMHGFCRTQLVDADVEDGLTYVVFD